MQSEHEVHIAQCVSTHYKMNVDSLTRIYKGLGSRNWLLCAPEGQFFVTEYHRNLNLEGEKSALELSEYAYQCGIPTPKIIRTRSCDTMCVGDEVVFALFEHVPKSTSGGMLSFDQMAQAGKVLGRIHHHFKCIKTNLPSVTSNWMEFNEDKKTQEINNYLDIIERKKEPDDFDRVTYHLLLKKKEMVREVPKILKRLPDLVTQVIHNDYSNPNLMFKESQLTAVLDFRPPNPFLIGYELGRIALNPENLGSSDWIQKSAVLVEEYCKANEVDIKDVLFAPSIWLVQLIRSTYGVKQHYMNPQELQSELDDFWFRRTHAAELVFENIKSIEDCFESVWRKNCKSQVYPANAGRV
jgi:homoserine kinase type II